MKSEMVYIETQSVEMRVWYSGITRACQARETGSIPVTRSKIVG